MVGSVSSKVSYLLQEKTSNFMDTSNIMKTSSTQHSTATQTLMHSIPDHQLISESSKVIGLMSSKFSSLLHETTETTLNIMDTSHLMKISSTQHTTATQPTRTTDVPSLLTSTPHMVTTIEILPAQTMVKPTTRHVKTTEILPTSTIASHTTAFSMSKTTSLIDATEKSSKEKPTSVIVSSIVIAPSSYGEKTLEIQKFLTSQHRKISSSKPNFPALSQSTMTTNHRLHRTKSTSQFLKHPQTSHSQAHSLDLALGASSKTREISTNSEKQQSTNFPESLPGHISTVNPTKPSSYRLMSSHEQGKQTLHFSWNFSSLDSKTLYINYFFIY